MGETKKYKILVVDDEAPIREFLYAILTEDGYQVITASDGQEALMIAVKEQPDLVLLDIMMPNLDGMETCRQLRERPTTRNIRIIILTAYNTRDRLEESIIAGADDFLGKPVDVTELRVRIRSMLRVKDMSDEAKRLEEYLRTIKSLRGETPAN